MGVNKLINWNESQEWGRKCCIIESVLLYVHSHTCKILFYSISDFVLVFQIFILVTRLTSPPKAFFVSQEINQPSSQTPLVTESDTRGGLFLSEIAFLLTQPKSTLSSTSSQSIFAFNFSWCRRKRSHFELIWAYLSSPT